MTQILVPVLGESVSEATVAQWLKKEGEAVAADEPGIDWKPIKSRWRLMPPAAGVISKIVVGEEKISRGWRSAR
ncbi:MAG: biotin/lipoyl-containing protein [Alphaproteobacteria bacterium]